MENKIFKGLIAVAIINLALIFIVSGFVLRVRTSNDIDYENVEKIEFYFHDSSVAPEYHRSYDIVIQRSKISKRVHSYGKEISLEQVELGGEGFEGIVDSLKKSNIQITSGDSNPQDGCTGGTGYSINIYYVDNEIERGKQLKCGGSITGNLKGDVNYFDEKINEYFK